MMANGKENETENVVDVTELSKDDLVEEYNEWDASRDNTYTLSELLNEMERRGLMELPWNGQKS